MNSIYLNHDTNKSLTIEATAAECVDGIQIAIKQEPKL